MEIRKVEKTFFFKAMEGNVNEFHRDIRENEKLFSSFPKFFKTSASAENSISLSLLIGSSASGPRFKSTSSSQREAVMQLENITITTSRTSRLLALAGFAAAYLLLMSITVFASTPSADTQTVRGVTTSAGR